MTDRDPTSDAEVVRRVLAGAVDDFELLVERYQDRIYNLVWGMVRDPGQAEDVTQEVFVKTFRKLADFEQKSRFYTWIYRIAINRSLDFIKSRDRARTHAVDVIHEIEPAAPTESTDPSAPLLEREFLEKMHEALEAVPPKFREILVLREVQGLSYDEIADVLGCSKGTVESRLFRARARLKRKLEAYCRR